jgi:hypothetical protein
VDHAIDAVMDAMLSDAEGEELHARVSGALREFAEAIREDALSLALIALRAHQDGGLQHTALRMDVVQIPPPLPALPAPTFVPTYVQPTATTTMALTS